MPLIEGNVLSRLTHISQCSQRFLYPPCSGAPSEESNVRTLRGHKSAITALHAGTRSELGDLGGDADEVGYFVSGCTDGTLKLWDPSMRGNEFQATFIGHTGSVQPSLHHRTHFSTVSFAYRLSH